VDRDEFVYRLQLASRYTLEFSRRYVWNTLPEHCRYLVRLGEGDRHLECVGEMISAEDAQRWPEHVGPLDVAGVVAWLWRDSTIPEWINIRADFADETSSYLELLHCARFTDQDHRLDFPWEDTSPFQVLGPCLPRVGYRVEDDGTFDLHWYHKWRRSAGSWHLDYIAGLQSSGTTLIDPPCRSPEASQGGQYAADLRQVPTRN
jgi:hypothetical protein